MVQPTISGFTLALEQDADIRSSAWTVSLTAFDSVVIEQMAQFLWPLWTDTRPFLTVFGEHLTKAPYRTRARCVKIPSDIKQRQTELSWSGVAVLRGRKSSRDKQGRRHYRAPVCSPSVATARPASPSPCPCCAECTAAPARRVPHGPDAQTAPKGPRGWLRLNWHEFDPHAHVSCVLEFVES